jgi:hypothetical protein
METENTIKKLDSHILLLENSNEVRLGDIVYIKQEIIDVNSKKYM